MWGLPAMLMQIEIEVLPAVLGAAIFISCLLLSRLPASNSKISLAPQKNIQTLGAEWNCPHKGKPPHREEVLPEPAPEPTISLGPCELCSLQVGAHAAAKFLRALALIITVVGFTGLLCKRSLGSASSSTSAPKLSFFEGMAAPALALEWTMDHPGSEVRVDKPEVHSSADPEIRERDALPSSPDMATSSFDAAEPVVFSPSCNSTDSSELFEQTNAAFADDGHAEEVAPLSVKLIRQTKDPFDDDYARSAYYGMLKVGNPAMEMTVVFDTGSGNLIIPSMFCHSPTCKAHRRYKRSRSYTARDINSKGESIDPEKPRELFSVSFGTGEATGVLIEDVVCLGNIAKINFSLDAMHSTPAPGCINLQFIAATALSEEPFMKFSFDGVLGLGLPGLSRSAKFNFMNLLADSIQDLGGRRSTTFGVFLATSNNEDSEIALAGWAREHLAEDLSWNHIENPELGHWILPIRHLWVDNYKVEFCNDGSCKVAVDTGTALFSVPTDFFQELYSLLVHHPPLSGHCKGHGPMLHLELEHYTVSLGPAEYSDLRSRKKPAMRPRRLKLDNCTNCTDTTRRDLMCQPSLMTIDMPAPLGPKIFILGEPGLRKYYTVYDANRMRIGFGRAKHHPVELTYEELLTAAPELGGHSSATAGRAARAGRQRRPTMFDIFRWQKAAQSRVAW